MSEVAKSVNLANSKKKKISSNVKKVVQSIRLNWKATLGLSYTLDSVNQINTERVWSEFSSNLRKLCPETKWYSIFLSSNKQLDLKLIFMTAKWMKSVVASKNWPFPSTVILKYDSKNSQSIQILVNEETRQLPFVEAPEGMIIARIKSKQFHGWEIRSEQSIHTYKAGHA